MAKYAVKNVTKVLALLLAVIMMFSACGEADSTDSNHPNVDKNGSIITDNTGDNNDGTESTKETGSANKTGSGSKTTSKSTTNNKNTNNASGKTTTTKSTKWTADYLSSIPSSVKSKEIHVLMWRKYDDIEKATVNAFEKATGIKVKTTVSNQYATKLAQLISGKDSPDVVAVGDIWPGTAVNCLQTLDPYTFRLDDSIWSKDAMDNNMVNGKYYGVAVDGVWSCDDTLYCTYYAPSVLQAAGITSNPWQLYKQGKWDWSTLKSMAKTFNSKYGGKKNAIMDLAEDDLYMLASGYDFVSYSNGRYTNNLSSGFKKSIIVKAWKEAAQQRADKLLNITSDATILNNGNTAFFNSISYGLYSKCDWYSGITIKGGVKGLEAVPIAGPSGGETNVPYRPKCWGVAKGADNVEGAAYFLRYFLDPKTNGFSGSFGNNQFKEVFQVITGKNSSYSVTKIVRGTYSVMDYQQKDAASSMFRSIAGVTADQVESKIDSYKGTIDSAINTVNTLISKRAK